MHVNITTAILSFCDNPIDIPQADPEVVVYAQRRQFSVAEKQRILAEADACQGAGKSGIQL